jgi:hypothetical protein
VSPFFHAWVKCLGIFFLELQIFRFSGEIFVLVTLYVEH